MDMTSEEHIVSWLPIIKSICGRMSFGMPSNFDRIQMESDAVLRCIQACRNYNPSHVTSDDPNWKDKSRMAYIRSNIYGACRESIRNFNGGRYGGMFKKDSSYVSLDRLVDAGIEFADTKHVSGIELIDMEDSIEGMYKGLQEIERKVLRCYYLESKTLAETGNALGLTESRVAQLRIQAITFLKTKLKRRIA